MAEGSEFGADDTIAMLYLERSMSNSGFVSLYRKLYRFTQNRVQLPLYGAEMQELRLWI